MKTRHLFSACVALFTMGALACHTREPESPVAGLTKPVDPPKMPIERGPPVVEIEGPYSMYVTESVFSLCEGPDPFFTFDTAQPTAGDQPTIKNLVACMTTGPLRGRTIRLVGHTDPRGAADHNEKLGLDRAEKVKAVMVGHGIDDARIVTASAGATDAHADPAQWGKDRRVAIELVK